MRLLLFLFAILLTTGLKAETSKYTVHAGDVLEISIWKEENLQKELRVLPDGTISFPLAGVVNVAGKTLTEVQKELAKKISDFVPDPVVNISVKSVEGNAVYVIGQVKNPGQFVMHKGMDVMQILSLAGGLTPFAKANDIIILRRTKEEGARAINFKYGDIESGDNLDENYLLNVGDVIVVP